MFKDNPVFFSFSVDNLQRAKVFYSQTLGLDVSEMDYMDGLLEVHPAGGGTVMIYPKEDHIPASFTVLNITVASVEQAVDDLTKSGVHFEVYDEGDLKTDQRGISIGEAPKIAWFKDPAGNILSMLETPS